MSFKYFRTGLFFAVCLALSPCYGSWETEANDRIELIRKRNVQITVVDANGSPLNNVDVQINQVKHRFGFGTALAAAPLDPSTGDDDYKDFVRDHFEWAVCENDMKWSECEYTRDDEDYEDADIIADWCADNNIVLRGHNLVWETGSQTPNWVFGLDCDTYPTPSEMLEEVDERINSIVGRYAGQIVSWDVDNEMLSGNMFDCLGEAGRAHFFQQGNSIDPNCGFYMNEYSGNSFGGYDGNEYVARARGLIDLGAPVEGLGIQGHVASPFRPEDYYYDVLNELDDVGLPIVATEFDTDAGSATQVADDLENFYRICFSHPNVEAIIMWGFDQSSWRWNGIVNSTTWTLNTAGVRYEALMDEWTTTDSNTTNGSGNVYFRGFHGTYEITLTASGAPAEVHTIELEPGETTAEFVLHMDIGPPDTTPPEPDPMEWTVDGEPTAISSTGITMTAADACDNNPPVYYYFECTNYGDANSDWQEETTYVAENLTPDTQYTFKVKARDNSTNQNETDWSSAESATTNPPDTTPPTPDPCWASPPAPMGQTSITMTSTIATDAESPPVQYYFECITDGDANSDWQTETTYVATGLNPLTSYKFRVKARDDAFVQNETAWSIEESATTYPPSGGDVEIVGNWTSGLSHTEETGTNRALIFVAHVEDDDGDPDLSSVTYGGQPMTKVIDKVVESGENFRAYVVAYILDEAGISSATGDAFTPNWAESPDVVAYSSVFLQNVDQTALIGASDSSSTTSSTTITTDALSTEDGDMVIDAATCGDTGTYTVNNGFTEAIEHTMSSSDGVAGYKSATGVAETPSVTHTTSANRQVLIGFVVQAGSEWLYGDFTGDDIVDMNDMPGFCTFWLMDDCSDTNAIDLNEDCVINFHEFSVIGYNWLK